MWIYDPCVQMPVKVRRRHWIPGTQGYGVAVIVSSWIWDLNLSTLVEQEVLLSSEPFLHSWNFTLLEGTEGLHSS